MGIGPQPRVPRIVQTLPASGPAGDFIFSVADNAAYIANNAGAYQVLDTGSSDITGSGTANTVAKFTGAGSIGNSLLTDDATTLTYSGSGGVKAPVFVSAAANPADSGAIRLGNTELIAWEAATPGTDWTLGVNANDVLLSNAPIAGVNISPGFATTATAAATTTLTVASKGIQAFTGSTTQIVVLPVVTTLPQTGFQFVVLNDSSGAVTINSSGGNAVKVMAAGSRATFTCILLTGTTAASWGVAYLAATAGITNSAGANVVPKSDGTNLVASRISDDGTNIAVDSGVGTTLIGDVNGAANGTRISVNDSDGNIYFTNGFVPEVAGNAIIGLPGKPVSSVYVGDAANNSSRITGTFTGNRVATLPDATGTVALVGVNLGTVLSIPSANATLASATGTTYSSPGYGGTPLASTTESQVGWVCPRAGAISTLYVITGSIAKVNTPATTITIRKNGVDTALTLVLTQTTATVTSDLTHSFSVAAGDVITISFTTTGAAAVSTSIAGVSFLLN